MGFTESVKVGLNQFFTATGRATLSEFWWYYIFVFIITAVLAVIGGFIENYGMEQVWLGIIFQCISAVLAISLLCAEIRRLHDTGKSGWNVCWGLIPLIGWIIVIVMLCRPSQPGANQYGDSPYDKY